MALVMESVLVPASVMLPVVILPAPLMSILVSASVMLMPPQFTSLPTVRPAPSEVPSQVATSAEVGNPGPDPPDQLPATVRSLPVAALVAVAAEAEEAA